MIKRSMTIHLPLDFNLANLTRQHHYTRGIMMLEIRNLNLVDHLQSVFKGCFPLHFYVSIFRVPVV